MQKRHTAAAGRAEQERRAVLSRDLRKLYALGRNERLVRGNNVLTRLERHGTVAERGLYPAHDLRDRSD